MRKTAFTLSEVFITIGIVGIVAAMTIPLLSANVANKGKISALRKAQSIMNQTIKISSAENGDFLGWNASLSYKDYIKQYIAPYIKITNYCETPQKCGYKGSETWTRYNKNPSYGGFNYSGRIPIITTEGILYSIILSGSNNIASETDIIYDTNMINKLGIFVDVNASAGPNRFGNDVFVLIRTIDGTVMPLGYNLTQNEIDQDCSKNGLCLYCAEKLRRNNWKSTTDYPW